MMTTLYHFNIVTKCHSSPSPCCSTGLCYHPETGPFRAAQLIVYANCEWQLQCPVVEQGVLESGSLSGGACEKELTDLANQYLTCRHTFCPGLPSILANVEVELGYLPKPVKFDNFFFNSFIDHYMYYEQDK